jgi:Flp pilus assembly protein TadG
MKIMAKIHRKTTRQRGQALAEMALVVLLFVVLTLGIIDFGRMLMVLNVITHAARDGARIAALTNNDLWSGGALTGAPLTALQTRVRNQMATVMSQSDADAFTVTPSRAAGGAAGEEAQVRVQGSVPFIFNFPPMWGGSITVNRVATYRFEG